MTEIDYKAILSQALDEFAQLLRDRRDTDWRLAQKEQFIRATVNMLPDEDKQAWVLVLDELSHEPATLSEAIRDVLQRSTKKTLTAAEVRDALKKNGFDFSSYTTNPLSSVHAALKRMKPEEVEMETIDGVMAWRWIGPKRVIPVPVPPEIAKIFEGVRARPLRRISKFGVFGQPTTAQANVKLANQILAERTRALDSFNTYLEGLKKEQDKKK